MAQQQMVLDSDAIKEGVGGDQGDWSDARTWHGNCSTQTNRDPNEEFFGQHNTECCSCLLL